MHAFNSLLHCTPLLFTLIFLSKPKIMRFHKLKLLGSGSYGRVHLALSLENPYSTSFPLSFIAVKSTDIRSSSSLIREKKFLDQLVGCPYIIQCFGHDLSIEKGQRIYNLMLENAVGGTLMKLIKERGGRIQESEVACYTTMLVHGLTIAHSKGIVHCDLKPDNILVFPMEERKGILNHVVKIADFGLAKKVGEKENYRPGQQSFNRGALLYASPEAAMWGVHEPAHDVWSLGCIIVEMLTGQPIWRCCNSRDLLVQQIVLERPKIPECVSEIGRDFLTKCLEREPSKRWTTQMLIKHPFISNSRRHFRGIENHNWQRNPFGYDAPIGICRTHTFSYVEGLNSYIKQSCLPDQIFQEWKNQILLPDRIFQERNNQSCLPDRIVQEGNNPENKRFLIDGNKFQGRRFY